LYNHFYILCLLSLHITTISNLFAQTDSIIIEHLSTKDGLSHKHIHCVIEDSYGFLWVGTDDGLNRYDGYEFIVYKNDFGYTSSLSSPVITVLTEDKNGNIWVGTPNGLNLYQRHTDSFVRFNHDPENEYSISNNGIDALLIDSKNSNYVWIGTNGGGLNLFDIDLQRFYSINHNPENNNSLGGDNVQALFQDSFGDFWIGVGNSGLDKINLSEIPITSEGKYDFSKFKSIAFEHFLNEREDSEEPRSSWVYNIYEDRARTLWVLSGSRVLNFNREKNKPIISPLFNEQKYRHFHEMLVDRKGIFWFSEHNRVFQLDRNTNKIKEYKLNVEDTRSSSNQGLCEDNAGNIWIATWDGIVKLNRKTLLFENYFHNVNDPSLPASNTMYSILADRFGKVWIGTYQGLIVMIKDNNGSARFINYSEIHQINKGSVFSLIEDNKGSIWAVIGYTLVRIDPRTNSIVQYKNNPENTNALSFQKKLGNFGSVNLLIDDADNLWISTWSGGISRVSLEEIYSKKNLRDVKFTNYFNNPDDPASSVLNFTQDGFGHLWICTRSEGLIKFDPETETLKNYKQELNNPRSININWALTAHEDKKGNIWIGTYGGGLNKFDRNKESFTHYTTKDGLPDDIIRDILEDDDGNLWISTHSGITKFNPGKNKFRVYDIQKSPVSFRDKLTGRMYFGDDSGFIVFHPDSAKESSNVPPIVITKFTRFSEENEGKQIIDRTISAKEKIELNYTDNLFSFEFAAVDFSSDKKYYYAYQLEGLNKNWINIGNKREVTLTNLDPGDYTFKVKACNEDGIWCENYASIGIYISPPWWSTWWSYVTYGLLFLSALYGVRKFEMKRKKEKEDRRILELENKRKTEELEEARHLQLSMLPKEIPSLTNLDIAVYMKTATEVGGDYYDFHISDENTLTTIIGDATGHGLNAGMLVSVTKGLFKNLANQPFVNNIISQFNESIHSLNIQPMYMSLHLLRIKGHHMQVIGAGMPPVLYYQSSTENVVEIDSSGPPLGGFMNFKYEKCDFKLTPGDVIVVMTDGFAERRNNAKEIYGWDKGREILSRIKNQTSDRIIAQFVDVNDDWGEGNPQDDDITFVVIKVK
jgi:serine phosphatase RsbU (regulator of sigma subunit)/ligand-binding sensor domain-containing protein